MTHLLILCEGDTEERVLRAFLRPYWQTRFDTIDIQRYDGNQDLRINFKGDAERQITQEPTSSVVCLVDLYEEPFGLYRPVTMTVEEGYQLVRDYMYKQINSRFHTKFGAFPVVMEVETWALADPVVQRHLGEIIPQPEEVRHPCGLLENNYKERNKQYGKILDGVALFGKANAERVYADHCPHFNELADWLANPPIISTISVSATIIEAQQAWEKQRDEIYQNLLILEQNMTSDNDLEQAIIVEQQYKDFILSYDNIFKLK